MVVGRVTVLGRHTLLEAGVGDGEVQHVSALASGSCASIPAVANSPASMCSFWVSSGVCIIQD